MFDVSFLLILIIIVALIFDFTNGAHDCANAIATVVSTKVLSPRTAVIMAATLNLIGAFLGTKVANTLGSGMFLIMFLCAKCARNKLNTAFTRLQVLSAAFMATSHGMNDAQKTMGVITLALFIFNEIEMIAVPLWVKCLCAAFMALGTAMGGWKIVKTMGHKIFKLEPVHGFASETSAALVISGASLLGAPISTTHTITACIFGVKFDIIDKSTGIFYGLYRSPDDFVGSGIQFFVDMIPGGTDSGMDTSPFGKFQCFGSHFDVFFYSPGQSTDGWNGYCFRNLYNGIEIPGTRDGETGFDDVYTQFLELPGNFYLFDCIQLTPRNLLCIPKGGIEYIYFFTHEVMR